MAMVQIKPWVVKMSFPNNRFLQMEKINLFV